MCVGGNGVVVYMCVSVSSFFSNFFFCALWCSIQVIVHVFMAIAAALKKDLEMTRSKFNETSEKLMEKTRQYQKLQVIIYNYDNYNNLCSINGEFLSLHRVCMKH